MMSMNPQPDPQVAHARRGFSRSAAPMKVLIRQIEANEPVDWPDFGQRLRALEIAAHQVIEAEEQARKGAAA